MWSRIRLPRTASVLTVTTIVLSVVAAGMLAQTRKPEDDIRAKEASSEKAPVGRAMAARMCSGEKFEPSENDRKKAERLMSGKLHLGVHPGYRLPDDPTWAEDPYDDQNWRSQYQKLIWTDVLRREGMRTGNRAMLRRWEVLLRDWMEDNAPGKSQHDIAWGEVPTAMRATSLACAVELFGMRPWIRDALMTHGRVLADPANRVELGNHGIFQNGGLLVVGCVTGKASWTHLAYRRAEELFETSVDEQGVSNESISYQGITYRRWTNLLERTSACGLPPWKNADRIDRMGDILAHAAAPDGHPAMIGDTFPYLSSYGIPGTPSEYAASDGRSGEQPADLVRVFDRGYAFGRSGWGTQRPFENETFWSFRFGQPLSEQVHGHEDHGSIEFASHGRRLLWDQGTYKSDGGEMRQYVRSHPAHNVVDVAGAAYDQDARSTVIAREHTATHDLISVNIRALTGVTWTRTLFASRAGRYLLVDDRVQSRSGAPSDAVQRFHLGADRAVRLGEASARTEGSGTDVGLFWIGEEPRLTVVRGQRNPLLGWRALRYGEADPVPVVEARLQGSAPRFTTVAVPLPGRAEPDEVTVTDAHQTSGKTRATITSADTTERISVSREHATVVPASSDR